MSEESEFEGFTESDKNGWYVLAFVILLYGFLMFVLLGW